MLRQCICYGQYWISFIPVTVGPIKPFLLRITGLYQNSVLISQRCLRQHLLPSLHPMLYSTGCAGECLRIWIDKRNLSNDQWSLFDSVSEILWKNPAFVSKFNGDLTSLLASSFIGTDPETYDSGNHLAIDPMGNVIVGCTTKLYSGMNTVDERAFVSKLNPDLTAQIAYRTLDAPLEGLPLICPEIFTLPPEHMLPN